MAPEPIEVSMPEGQALARCYRLADTEGGDDSDQANVHLLAALGRLDQPFVPVMMGNEYDGYSWARLPTVDRVQVRAGKTLQESWVNGGLLICVDSLSITAYCSDGKRLASPVCMAVRPGKDKEQRSWCGQSEVYVTPQARQRVSSSQIWFHLDGFNEEGDSYDTQERDFDQELEGYWMRLSGPAEPMRCRLMDCLSDLPKGWRSVTIQPDGRVIIRQGDGREDTLLPPRPAPTEEVGT